MIVCSQYCSEAASLPAAATHLARQSSQTVFKQVSAGEPLERLLSIPLPESGPPGVWARTAANPMSEAAKETMMIERRIVRESIAWMRIFCDTLVPMKPRRPHRRPDPKTSWEPVSEWYGKYVKHGENLQHSTVFPGALKLLEPRENGRYHDVACGEGAFTRL